MNDTLFKIGEFEMQNSNIPKALACPACGGTSMHSKQITAYMRPEDGPLTYEAAINGAVVVTGVVPSSESNNPSGRRGGIIIGFWCEDCDDGKRLELLLIQHKGQTLPR